MSPVVFSKVEVVVGFAAWRERLKDWRVGKLELLLIRLGCVLFKELSKNWETRKNVPVRISLFGGDSLPGFWENHLKPGKQI